MRRFGGRNTFMATDLALGAALVWLLGCSLDAPAPAGTANDPVDDAELEVLRQHDGFNPEFYGQRRSELRSGPWRPYELGTERR